MFVEHLEKSLVEVRINVAVKATLILSFTWWLWGVIKELGILNYEDLFNFLFSLLLLVDLRKTPHYLVTCVEITVYFCLAYLLLGFICAVYNWGYSILLGRKSKPCIEHGPRSNTIHVRHQPKRRRARKSAYVPARTLRGKAARKI